MDIQTSVDKFTKKVTLVMTPQQQDMHDIGRGLTEQITKTLTEQYIKDFGDKILESISPEIIADDIKKYVSNKFWYK